MKIDESQVVEVNEKNINRSVSENSSTNENVVNNDEFEYCYHYKSNKFKYIMIFLFGFIILCVGFYVYGVYTVKDKNVVVSGDGELSKGINNVYDATVYIETLKDGKVVSSGTGVIYKKGKKKAYILTNNHVVSSGSTIKVILSGGEKVSAKLLSGDAYIDIACLSIDNKYVKKVATFGSVANVELGDTLFTVGSPLGEEYIGTVTRGILSGKDREVSVSVSANNDYVMKVIQTDAAMNPGNSGGPLCNINGEVIGINSLKFVKNEVEGMGFAIAIDDIKQYIDVLEKGNRINRPYLGVKVFNLSEKGSVEYYGLDGVVNTKLDEGIVIHSIEKKSPADGKLQRGDIVTKINGVGVNNVASFRYELFKCNSSDKVNITVERNGKFKDVSVVLKSLK